MSSSSGSKFFYNIPSRLVLYFLSLTCIIVSFLLRTVMNIAILAMVKENNVSESYMHNAENVCKLSNNGSVKIMNYGGTLEWSLDVQYYVLTTFYWTYIVSQIFGAIAAQKYGAKVVIWLAILISSICNLLIPLGSDLHYGVVITLQALSGLSQGFIWPAMYAMISWWIPLHEKSRYVTCFQGLSLGSALSQILSGYIIAYFGWIYSFYCFGVLGIIWCLCWYFLAYDTPELHPRIALDELIYIKTNREQNMHSNKTRVPWLSILLSYPIWIIALCTFGRMWIQSIVQIYGPKYLKTIIGLEVQMNGLVSCLISVASFLWVLIISYISDKLETHKIISTVMNRKLFAGIGSISAAILCVSMKYFSCNEPIILTLWALIPICLQINFIGTMPNSVDVSPNFAGPVSSIIQMVLLSPNIFATFVAKMFLKEGSTISAWNNIFITAAGVLLVTNFFFAIFATSKVQKWDKKCDQKSVSSEDIAEELKILNS